MTFDGITMHAVVAELKQKLLGGHIKKINQIGPSQLTIAFYANGEHFLLYLSCDASNGRLHLTTKKYANPTTPPNFVMLLRKHLGQGKLIGLEQVAMDRTVRLRFQTRNELGDSVEKQLVLEVMGRHSNLILLDEKDRILEAIHRVSYDMSRVRQIYPGKTYTVFPANKRDVLTQDICLALLLDEAQKEQRGGVTIKQLFYGQLTGFSPLVAVELCVRADVKPDTPIGALTPDEQKAMDRELSLLVTALRNDCYHPTLYRSPKNQAYPFALTQYGTPAAENESISALIDQQTAETARDDGFGQRKESLRHRLALFLDKKMRKRDHLREDEAETENRQEYKEEADLLAAYAHTVNKGKDSLIVNDFFHENRPRTIPLDPKKSGHENMEAKYRLFSKLNTAHKLLSETIPEIEEEIRYLEQLGEMLEQTQAIEELEAVEQEFEREGILPKRKKKAKKATTSALPPREFLTKNGFTILVGRNNAQNDHLTLKVADKEDLFFHSKTVPGAHVILRTAGQPVVQEDIEAAAYLAARYSSRNCENAVEIDYTQKKHVYKAKGAKPGMVYYKEFHTLVMNPQASAEHLFVEKQNLLDK